MEYSRDFVPLRAELTSELLKYREEAYPTEKRYPRGLRFSA